MIELVCASANPGKVAEMIELVCTSANNGTGLR